MILRAPSSIGLTSKYGHSPCPQYRKTLDRRTLLRIGASIGLGFLFPSFLEPMETFAAPPTSRASAVRDPLVMRPIAANGSDPGTSIILIVPQGGMSHIETFNPFIEGFFNTIPTSVPGVHFTEPLPLLAQRMRTMLLVNNLFHRNADHREASALTFTGYPDVVNIQDFYTPSVYPPPLVEFSQYPSQARRINYVLMHHNEPPGPDIDPFIRPMAGLQNLNGLYVPWSEADMSLQLPLEETTSIQPFTKKDVSSAIYSMIRRQPR